MDSNLPRLYKDYGQYSNWRNMPFAKDGLKPVERRILLAAYKISRNGFVKSRQVDAYTSGHYHPHGSCLDGDTEISLLDGREIKIKDLLGSDPFWVYSCKPDGEIVPGLAHSVRVTKYIDKLLKITLDNNSYFICTSDHLIMLRDGNYSKAGELKINQSLMPLHRRQEDGYKYYLNNIRKPGHKSEKVCWMVVRNLINENINELKGRKKYHVHHKNNIRNDDRPENLEFLYYKKHAQETGKNLSEESRNIIGIKHKFLYDNNINNYKDKAIEGLEKGRKTMFSFDSPIRERIKNKNSKLIKNYNKIYVKERILKILRDMKNNNIEINEENYEIFRKKVYNGPFWKTINEKFGNIKNALYELNNNHKIKNIEIIQLEKEIPVYDLTVDKYNNFALTCGIFVHNCYSSIVQLVRQGFLDGQGNFGSTIGIEPVGAAADRYTECKINKKTIDLAFKYIDTVPWQDTELSDREPAFLPTMFPLCLLGTSITQGIGFGFKTYIPCYNIKDLHKRLLYLLGVEKKKPTILPLTDCKILSPPEVLEDLLTKGKARLDVQGVIEEYKHQNKVIVRSWAPGRRFPAILNKFEKELSDGLIGWIDLSASRTEIVFEVIRERNRDKIYTDFVAKLKEVLKGTISFEISVIDDDFKVLTKSVDDMLLDTYKMFEFINKQMLENEINKISNTMSEYNMLEKIIPILTKCIQQKINFDESIKLISEKTNFQIDIIKMLTDKYKIKKLLTLNTDTTELKNIKASLYEDLKNLKSYVIKQYEDLKPK